MIDEIKIHRIVEYIRQFPFEYNPDEVRDELHSILYDFRIFEPLSREEQRLLVAELQSLAELYQTGEVMFLLRQEEESLDGLLV